MRSLFRIISRFLLLTILAGVLSPAMAGEVMALTKAPAVMAHAPDHMAQAEHAGHDGHALGLGSHHDAQHDMPPASHCPGGAEECKDVRHHCCPGHQVGFLLNDLGLAGTFLFSPGNGEIGNLTDSRLAWRAPDRIEHPPRPAAG
jgi:hypothetical protein